MSEREKFEKFITDEGLVEFDGYYFSVYPSSGKYEHKPTEVAWKAWQSATAQAESEGCVVVPKKPTKNMINQGYEAHDGFFTNGAVVDVWEAMIKAAQENN